MEPTPELSGRILLVDDEAAILRTFRYCLEDRGYTVVTAASAAQAEAILQRQVFDLCFLDLRLGEDSGLDVLAHMRVVAPCLVYALPCKLHGSGEFGGGEHHAPGGLARRLSQQPMRWASPRLFAAQLRSKSERRAFAPPGAEHQRDGSDGQQPLARKRKAGLANHPQLLLYQIGRS